jgi:hypothetical protein
VCPEAGNPPHARAGTPRRRRSGRDARTPRQRRTDDKERSERKQDRYARAHPHAWHGESVSGLRGASRTPFSSSWLAAPLPNSPGAATRCSTTGARSNMRRPERSGAVDDRGAVSSLPGSVPCEEVAGVVPAEGMAADIPSSRRRAKPRLLGTTSSDGESSGTYQPLWRT